MAEREMIVLAARTIPDAPGLPVLRNAVDLFNDPYAFLVRSFLTVGPVFRADGVIRNYVCLAGPQANWFLSHGGEALLDQRPLYRHLPRELRSEHYPISMVGEAHHHMRRELMDAFSRSMMMAYSRRMADTAERVADQLPVGRKLRVLDMMHRFVGDEFGMALANHPIGADLDAVRSFARVSIGSGLGAYPRVTLRVIPGYQTWKRQTMALLAQVVAEHRDSAAGSGRERDFIDVLLEGHDENGQPFSDADVMANGQMVFTNAMLYGGPAASFLLYGLLKNREARERVLAEVEGDHPLTLDVVEKLPALRGAVLESLRLWPIALATPRVAKETFDFEGYRIEAGTALLIAGSVCHALPEYFPEPEKFDIDRYAPPRNEHLQAGSPYVPFGIGLHACVAQDVIELMMAITVGTLLRRLVVELEPPDYVLHRVVNPFPEPESRFAIRLKARPN